MDSITKIQKISKALDINSEYLGVSSLLLMENAGREIAKRLEKFSKIAIFVGLGNNGGDGLVAARHLSSMGKDVTIFYLDGKRSKENESNFKIVEKLTTIEKIKIRDSKDIKKISLQDYDAVVDALLGVGVKGDLREPIKSIVSLINSFHGFKLSVDVPTPGIKPDLTLSFHFPKTKECEVVSIGIPREAEIYAGPGDVFLALKKREKDSHKGDFGKVIVVAGSRDYIGAPYLVAKASLKSGADLAFLASPEVVFSSGFKDPNLIPLHLSSSDYLSLEDAEIILKRIENDNFDVMVIGNGLATNKKTKKAVKKLVRETRIPCVIDADALKLIDEKLIKNSKAEKIVLTPHRGEFEKLFGINLKDKRSSEIVEIVMEKARDLSVTILLKSYQDIISDGKEFKINNTGNPGMTVGGTGDVLAGILASFLCNPDNSGFIAATAASFISGLAGDLAFQEQSYYFTALDVIDKIPQALKFCEKYF